jgi:hypothetical protein
VETFPWRLKLNSCHMHQHKTDRLTPHSRQTHSVRPHHRRIHSLRVSCYQNCNWQNLITIFSHRANGTLVHSNVTDIGYYIRSRHTEGRSPVTARSEAMYLIAWTLRSWFRISLKAWVLVLVSVCCVILCR